MECVVGIYKGRSQGELLFALHQVFSDLLELDGEVGVLDDELRLGLLKIRPLLIDYQGQQLVLQATLCDSEVDEGGLGLNLGRVVGVAELGVQDELEVLVVLHILVPQLDIQAASLQKSTALVKNRFTRTARIR